MLLREIVKYLTHIHHQSLSSQCSEVHVFQTAFSQVKWPEHKTSFPSFLPAGNPDIYFCLQILILPCEQTRCYCIPLNELQDLFQEMFERYTDLLSQL